MLPTAVAAAICVVLGIVTVVHPAFGVEGSSLETAVLLLGVLVGTALARRAARVS